MPSWAAANAQELDALADRHGRSAAAVFTAWFRPVREDARGADIAPVEDAYRYAAERLRGSGMLALWPVEDLCKRLEAALKH